jgi:hypothetical protein
VIVRGGDVDQHTPCQPSACPPVANDNYVVDEGHRLLTYLVPAEVQGLS